MNNEENKNEIEKISESTAGADKPVTADNSVSGKKIEDEEVIPVLDERVKYLGMMMTPAMKDKLEWVVDILEAFLIVVLILVFIRPVNVKQTSMVPTFQDGDTVIVSKQSYTWFGNVQRGDVIVFDRTENGSTKKLIKRVIGLPGETIKITDGVVYIDGKVLEESYLDDSVVTSDFAELTIPEGEYFVMGDNRTVSLDSRSFGTIKKSAIFGRVVFRLFPLKNFGIIRRVTY